MKTFHKEFVRGGPIRGDVARYYLKVAEAYEFDYHRLRRALEDIRDSDYANQYSKNIAKDALGDTFPIESKNLIYK